MPSTVVRYFTSPGESLAARRSLELEWERKLWKMLQVGTFDQRWHSVGLTLSMVQIARDGATARAAYNHLKPWVQIAAAAEFNRRQLRHAPSTAQKRWIARMDDRTRPAHRLLNGQAVPISQAFHVGFASIYHPGDTSAPIELWAGCRCTLVIIPAVT